MQTYQQTFAAATTWQLNVPGSYFVTLDCTQTVNVRLYKGGKKLDLGDINGLLAGLEIGPLTNIGDPAAFDRVEIDVQAGDTVKVGIGNGAARYNRGASSVTIAGGMNGNFGHFAANVTSAGITLRPAKANRRYLLIQNKDSVGNIWIDTGWTTATTTNGLKIPPGGSYEINGFCPSGPIGAISDIASNNNVIVVEG